MRFEWATEGKWIQPIRRGYKLCCCDCGSVHTMNFRIFKRHIQFQVFKNPRSTGQVRRAMKKADGGEG